MHTFYHPDHIRHDPVKLHHPDLPQRNAYYAETAQRGLLIHEAIETAAFGPITKPGDFGLEPIGAIHDYEMLVLLQNAYERAKLEEGSESAIPNTFDVRHTPRRRLYAIWSQLGHYCFDTSSPIFEHTWDVAYWSAQTAISAAALVMASGEQAAYGLCRPPGHHAAANLYGGFCYLNNAAIAANWLVQQGQRVAILDLDYHHGNGTQAIFYGRSDVLFLSIHADPLYEYPYYWGYADEYGQDAGTGFNHNYPLSRGCQENEYMEALADARRKVQAFVPDTLLISLGVDTYIDDPVGGFRLQTDTFTRLGVVIAAFDLPTVVIQEGGYALSHLGQNVVSFLSGLLGREPVA